MEFYFYDLYDMPKDIPGLNRPYHSQWYSSMSPGNPRDLPFDANEFINGCILVRNGPFVDENENWLRVVRMYDRMITLRIDPAMFWINCPAELLDGSPIFNEIMSVYEAPIGPHLFGLPFSVHEFLVICDGCEKYYTGDNKAAVPKYQGSDHLFFKMVADLAIERINIKDFLADQIPANLEKSTGLLRVLASAQGKHAQNFEIDYMRFIQSITANDGTLVGPMSYFQAAAFVQQLEPVQPPIELLERLSGPHGFCDAGVPADEAVYLHEPCNCGGIMSRCCLMMKLIKQGPLCFYCREDSVELVKSRGPRSESDVVT
jgi:hypothetical protein